MIHRWRYTSYKYVTETSYDKMDYVTQYIIFFSTSALCTVNVSCIKVYKRPEDGSYLESKYVAVNKVIKLVLCVTDLIHTHVTC
jgi:hypothetical protein